MTAIQTLGHDAPLTASDIRAQVNLIQEVMRGVMKNGEHFGTIPGCGNKPALFKPGAEKIMATFRIAAVPEVEDLSTSDEARYRVLCKGMSASGILLGVGVGECSSREKKYNWRSVVSNAEWDATPEDRRRINFTRNGEERQVRTNPPDVANTILKMAKKRALVDMVLTATAASDIFTQDIEEDDVHAQAEAKPATAAPQRRSAAAPAAKHVESKPVEQASQAAPHADEQPIFNSDACVTMQDGETLRVQGTLAWDAEKKSGKNGDYYAFKLSNPAGQPVSVAFWHDNIPDGMVKGAIIACDIKCKISGGKTYYNAENIEVIG